MLFLVEIPSKTEADKRHVLTIEADNWFAALRDAGQQHNEVFEMRSLQFSLMEDGHSAEAVDPLSGRTMRVIAQHDAPPTTQETSDISSLPTEVSPLSVIDLRQALTEAEAKKEPTPEKIESFSVAGSYSPGMTEDLLVDAFMKNADLHEMHGDDQNAAIQSIFEQIIKRFSPTGAILLLTDLNDPNRQLWVQQNFGPHQEEVAPLRLSFGRGLLGYCAENSVSMRINDLRQEEGFHDEILREIDPLIAATICVPVMQDEILHGLLVVFRHAGAASFSEGEENIIRYFADVLGLYYNVLRGI